MQPIHLREHIWHTYVYKQSIWLLASYIELHNALYMYKVKVVTKLILYTYTYVATWLVTGTHTYEHVNLMCAICIKGQLTWIIDLCL